MMMDFSNIDSDNISLDKGRSLLTHLSEADIDSSVALFMGDGAVDGAMYLIYRGLVESGHIEPVSTSSLEPTHCDKILTTVHLLKYIMYNCFIIGAEASKSVNELDALWNRQEAKFDDAFHIADEE